MKVMDSVKEVLKDFPDDSIFKISKNFWDTKNHFYKTAFKYLKTLGLIKITSFSDELYLVETQPNMMRAIINHKNSCKIQKKS